MLASGTQLGRYEIAAPLGTGGMGEVYRATDSRLDRQVAIKVLPPQFVQDQARLARFEREAKVVAALSHPNILGIHDFVTEQGQTFAVMELLEGQTLRNRISNGAIPWRKAVDIAIAIADGLAAAHGKSIVHRDLKPENIFLTTDGRVKVLDFGLARMEPISPSAETPTGSFHPAQTEIGAILGTVGYMSPEQVRGRDVDARSDIFSLGCVLYEMVTGGRAFARQSAVETMAAILHDEPPELVDSGKKVPFEVQRVIMHCLEKSPAARFHSAHDLAFALRALLSDSAVDKAFAPRASGRAVFWLGTAVLLVGLLCTSVFLPFRKHQPQTNPTTAVKTFDTLAVLPFVNDSQDADADYLSDGIPATIVKALTEVGRLKVRSFSSTSRLFKGRDTDSQEVGRQLNVHAVLAGKIVPRNDGLSISIELIDVSENITLWSWNGERPREQVVALPKEIVQQLCARLGVRATAEEDERLARLRPKNNQAYELYLRGRWHFNKFTDQDVRSALRLFQEAATLDPSYALAYSGIGDSYIWLADGFLSPKDAYGPARSAVREALRLDPELGEAHTSLGSVYFFYDLNWAEAEKEFRLAITQNSDHSLTHHLIGLLLLVTGRDREAAEAFQRAIDLDPSPTNLWAASRVPYKQRDFQSALEQLRKALELDRNNLIVHSALGWCHLHRQEYPQALAALQKARELEDTPQTAADLAFAQVVMGDSATASRILQELTVLRAKGTPYVNPVSLAQIHFALHEDDEGFRWLDEAVTERVSFLLFNLILEPYYDRLRTDPRFVDILGRMGLADKAAARDQSIGALAVLPFVYQSGDADAEFLADGIPQTLSTSLAQIRTLKVRPMSSVARFKDQAADDLFAVGKALQVQALVTGKIQKRGEQLFLTWQLADVRSNSIVDGANYSRPLADLFQLQEDLAKEIAGKLRLKLTGEDQRQLARRSTDNLKAFELYTIGRQHFLQFNEQGSRKAIDYYERAIREDPNYALAYAGLSAAYSVLTDYSSPLETVPKAKMAVAEALRLDDTLAEAHVSQGAIKLLHDWDWPAALVALERAQQLCPNDFAPPLLRSYHFIAMKRMEEALAEIKRAQALDPTALVVSSDIGSTLYFARQYDQAIAQFRKTLQMDSNFLWAHASLGFACLQKGEYEEARAALNKAVALSNRSPKFVAALAYGSAVAGQPNEARKLLAELLASSTERYVSPYDIALVYAGLEDTERAIAWLRKAHAEHSAGLIWFNAEPCFDNLRSDPRFQKIVADMKFPE